MAAYESHNEKLLFQQISAGDEQAFRTIFNLYKIRLLTVAIRLTKSKVIAEESTQEVFFSLWKCREHLAKVDDPSAYIYRSLFNKISTYLKKEGNQEKIIRDALRNVHRSCDNTEELVDEHDTQRLIENALVHLPAQQNIVYRLSRQHGLSNNEIASHLHVSQNTVKSHLSKAIWYIRSYLKNLAAIAILLKDSFDV